VVIKATARGTAGRGPSPPRPAGRWHRQARARLSIMLERGRTSRQDAARL